MPVEMEGVDGGEDMWAKLHISEDGRPLVEAFNEGGHNSTFIDIIDLIAWLRTNRPDLLGQG